MFHAKANLFFERHEDGSVQIIKRDSSEPDARMVMNVMLTRNEWASVIASMSYYGEEDYGFYRALNFHQGDPIPETAPLKKSKLK